MEIANSILLEFKSHDFKANTLTNIFSWFNIKYTANICSLLWNIFASILYLQSGSSLSQLMTLSITTSGLIYHPTFAAEIK